MSKAEALAPVFAALGDRTRLTLMLRLAGGAHLSIANLAIDTGLTRQAVTKHLRVLQGAGLVESAPVGRETRFVARADALGPARAFLENVTRQWDAALDRLRMLVEEK
ncbi:helix-turn-helix domain-containing protein [Sphingomonas sp. SUN019]|uniref:ArsR/SmtB family transcription factor n=1 Tax=Sphingomonas sp. SUN019 TaxID=2937788 RepID=UPI0021643101|nr:helix-turn-helix domain-containing protein [Sphingomonas sp. SUN019]UVO49576.1 helix-turn-helix domain-containing protein [Sphingomonas sp. SUN019]